MNHTIIDILDQAVAAHDKAKQEGAAPEQPISAARAAALVAVSVLSSTRDARKLANVFGCGGGSRDLDVAIGFACEVHTRAVVSGLLESAFGDLDARDGQMGM